MATVPSGLRKPHSELATEVRQSRVASRRELPTTIATIAAVGFIGIWRSFELGVVRSLIKVALCRRAACDLSS